MTPRKPISSTQEFIGRVFDINPTKTEELFYRGHSKSSFELRPRLLRIGAYKQNEDRLFRELLVLNSDDFSRDNSTLEQLVRMQHHSLPTRLLDVSSNPLIALYFSCKQHPDSRGEVIVLKLKRREIKFFDSDTASCIANLAKLTTQQKRKIDTTLEEDDFNQSPPIQRLLHFIKQEKPYFLEVIEPEHLNRVICVRTKFNNTRISSQVGASLLFGLDAAIPEDGDDRFGIQRIRIPATSKRQILRELDALNINESTVFPFIENSAKYLAAKYRDRGRDLVP